MSHDYTSEEARAAPAGPGLNRAQRRQAQRGGRRNNGARQARPVMVNAIDVARNRASRLTQAERERMLQPARDGFKALREGVASYDQWAYVASAVAMAIAIEAQGVVKGMRGHFEAAQIAINAIWHRAEDTPEAHGWGHTTLYFDEISALREAIHLHDFQLQHLSVSELHAAIALGRRNVRAAGGREIRAPAQSLPQPIQESLV